MLPDHPVHVVIRAARMLLTGRIGWPRQHGLAFVLGWAALGCGVSATGRFGDDAYYHRAQPIRISYREPSVKALISRDWYVENTPRTMAFRSVKN